jgi:hypothetical protein
MKQLLLLFLFLFLVPCLAWAQYPSNGNQKITLGEQTTADGLIFRGVLADTGLITPSSDTSAYIILDTVNHRFYNYSRATNVWSVAGGGTAVTSITGGTGLTGGTITTSGTLAADTNFLVTRFDTASMLTNYYRSGRTGIIQASDVPTLNQNTTGSAATLTTSRTFQTNLASTSTASFNGSANVTPGVTGTLPVANGGTGATSLGSANNIPFVGSSGNLTSSNNLKFDTTRLILSKNSDGTEVETVPSITIENKSTQNFSFASLSINANNNGLRTTLTADGLGTLISGGALIFRTITAHPFSMYTTNIERMRITAAGEVWIGYTTDNGAYPLQVNGQIFATNATIATSDVKFKENITPLNKGLEIVNKLKPVTFNFINNTENNFSEYEEVGFIAQDVDRALSTETFAKSIVKAADDSEPNSTMGLATQNLIPLLVKAIQEQQALIKALEQRLLILENK